jgi:DNA-binding NtrC family response regulator
VTTDNADDAELRLQQPADLVIVDLQFPGMNALDLLRRWRAWQPRTAFVCITEDRDVTAAVEAMKLGAADCLVRPVEPEELRILVAKLLDSGNVNGQQAHDRAGSGGGNGANIEIPPGTSLEDLQRAAVEQALAQHHGNRTHAAKTLGISVRTLQRKLKAWGIPLTATLNLATHHHFLTSSPAAHSAFSVHAH